MTLNELHDAIRAEMIRRLPEWTTPYYTLRVEIGTDLGNPYVKYSCYAPPHHKKWETFDSPEALLASICETGQDIPDYELPEYEDGN